MFRARAQAVQAVDRADRYVEATLQPDGVADNTYIVFSSDNGLHLGDHRLTPGQADRVRTDIHVPLIVAGPGVVAGRHVGRVTENIDLYPTFVRLGRAGKSPLVEGKSLVPLLQGDTVLHWRNAALIEHHGPDLGVAAGPDAPQAGSGNPLTYEALRLQHSIYVEYANGEREYYDLSSDPYELTNTYPQLSPQQVVALHSELAALENCYFAAPCQRAASRGRSASALATTRAAKLRPAMVGVHHASRSLGHPGRLPAPPEGCHRGGYSGTLAQIVVLAPDDLVTRGEWRSCDCDAGERSAVVQKDEEGAGRPGVIPERWPRPQM